MSRQEEDYVKLGFNAYDQREFPRIINVCVIRGMCPCKCVHCPVGITDPSQRNHRFKNTCMDIGLFKKIIDEASGYPCASIRIHGVGEPILWDSLADALRYARSKGVLTWLFTSLATDSKGLLEEIAGSCNIIEVSINSMDPLDYLNTKGIDRFGRVRENLEYIRAFTLCSGTGTRIVTSRVESTDSEYDQDFITFWKGSGLADDAFVRSYHSYNSIMPERAGEKAGKPVRCLVHWNRFNIDCDGTAVVCFNELFKENLSDAVILGNLRDRSISDIWYSEKLDSIRRAYIEGDLLKLPEGLPCAGCTSCQEEGAGRNTSEFQVKSYRSSVNG